MARTWDSFMVDAENIARALTQETNEERRICVLLHRDIGLGETDYSDEERVSIATRLGKDVEDLPEHDVDLTVEHGQLHQFLEAYTTALAIQGLGSHDIMSALVLFGKRLGAMESARLLNTAEQGDGDLA